MRKIRITVTAQHVRESGEIEEGDKIAQNKIEIPEDFFAKPMMDVIQQVLVPALFNALAFFAEDANSREIEIAELKKMMNA